MGSSRALRLTLLFVAVLGLYAGSFSFRRTTDSHLNSLQTRALVLHGDLALERYGPQPGFTVRRRGHVYSIYGAGISVAGAPFYAPLARAGAEEGILEGVPSLLYASAAVVAMALLLSQLFPAGVAATWTVAFAFGTTMWPTATTAFWQHAPVALLQTLGVVAFASDRERAPFWSGLAFGGAAFIRMPLAVPAVVFGLASVARGPKRAVGFIAGTAPFIAAILVENRLRWGSIAENGYSLGGPRFVRGIPALDDLLAGGWRGLFVYSPVLLVSIAGFVLAIARPDPLRTLVVAAGTASVAQILVYAAWSQWHGGEAQFGYRLLLDVVPTLIVCGAFATTRLGTARAVTAVLLPVSVATMAVGSVPDRLSWDRVPFPPLGDSPIALAWRAFADDPGPGIARLAAAAAVAAVIAIALRRERAAAT